VFPDGPQAGQVASRVAAPVLLAGFPDGPLAEWAVSRVAVPVLRDASRVEQQGSPVWSPDELQVERVVSPVLQAVSPGARHCPAVLRCLPAGALLRRCAAQRLDALRSPALLC
jgi:hypothetical protein